MTPDVEQLVGDWLRASLGIMAIVGTRVVGRTPQDTTEPWVRVSLLDDRPAGNSRGLHLINALVQIDCYAGATERGYAQEDAFDLARLVRGRLNDMPGTHGADVVTTVREPGIARMPDTDLAPARERYVVTATVYAHGTGA